MLDTMLATDRQIWTGMLAHLKGNHPALCRQWFEEIEPLGIVGGVLRLRAHSQIHRDYLQRQSLEPFKDAATASSQRLLAVQFFGPDDHVERVREEPFFPPVAEKAAPSGAAAASTVSWPLTSEPKKQADALVINPDYGFENFVLGPSNRLAHAAALAVAANPGRAYDQLRSPPGHPGYDDRRPSREVYERVVLGVALQALHAGSPMIYAGDEYGMFGADDPHCRKPVPWPDLGPTEDPADAHQPGLRERFRAWLSLRGDERLGPVLRYGSCEYVETDAPDLLVFTRRLNGQIVVAALNRNPSRAVEVDGGALSGLVPYPSESGDESRAVPPLTARVWMTPDLAPNR